MLVPAHARADETIVIVDDRPETSRDRSRALGDAPFVSVLHPDEHAANASVADAVATSAGAQVKSFGGLGAYQSISIRGASPGQTSVSIDGVPLARLAAVTTDLGRFALDAFGRVDVYRGTVPITLGGAGVGGAIDLVTRLGRGSKGERVALSIGGGSYGARHARAHFGDAFGDVKFSTTIGYAGAKGDYDFFDNNDTPLNLGDDHSTTRSNNGFDQGDLAARVASGELAGGVRLAYKRQGLPGATSRPTIAAKLSTLDAIVDGKIPHASAYAMVERQRLFDGDDELGLGAQRRGYVTLAGGAQTMWDRPLGDHRGAIGAELRGERFSEEDLDNVMPGVEGNRVGAAVLGSIDLNLAPDLVVTPAVRADFVRTAPAPMTVGPDAYAAIDPRVDIVPSPRLGVRALLREDLAIKGSAGYYMRLPTLLELFGNRGFVIGTPDLHAERGPSTDLGIVYAPRGNATVDRVMLEATAFGSRARDTIAFVTYAGAASRAQNIGRTQSYGGELAASLRFLKLVTGTFSYTRLVTAQASLEPAYDGRAIPRAPGHVFHGRTEIAYRIASVWTDTSYQASSFLDAANLGRVPARALLGIGATCAIAGGVVASFSVENVADTRVIDLPLDPPPGPTFTATPVALSDVAGFPLPGRSFYLALQWTH